MLGADSQGAPQPNQLTLCFFLHSKLIAGRSKRLDLQYHTGCYDRKFITKRIEKDCSRAVDCWEALGTEL
jgi:hypothetical protein